MKRWLLIAAAVLLGLPLVVLLAGLAWLWSGLPETRGRIAVAGLDAAAEIIRDERGVAHIFAASPRDAWFALGFVHAQDRLAQMEFMRRLGRGRLSEVVGPQTLDLDRFMRALGLAQSAEASAAALSPSARATLEAYAAGVNAELAAHRGPWPPEFLLAGFAPEPWQPADSLLYAQIMAFQLTGNWRDELARARLFERLSPAQRAELWPRWPADAATTLADAGALFRDLDLDRLAAALPSTGPDQASNEWVVAGARSATGRPLLVNDPHLGLGAPGQWYLAQIVAPGLTVTGATAPGVPAVVLGHNHRIAWGFTTTNGDATDLFIERVDPSDPTRYLTETGSEPFRTRRETIRVKGAADETMTVRFTRNGLVLSDLNPAARAAAGANQVLALGWLRFTNVDRSPEAMFALQTVQDWNGFTSALRDWHGPMQNIVYADVDGNIGFVAPAMLPLRGAADGWLPAPGWIDANRWRGTVPFEQLPQVFNPQSGRIANANNRLTGDESPLRLGGDFDAPYRALRIVELLEARPMHDRAGMEAMLADPVSRFARDLLPLLAGVPAGSERARAALGLLARWDGAMRRDRPEPLIFNAWMRAYVADLLRGPLGGGAETGRDTSTMLRAAFEGRSAFCAGGSPGCAERAAAALERALGELAPRYGDDPARWRWGDAHAATFGNALYSRIPVVRDLVGFRIPTDGDYYTINRGGSRPDGDLPFAHVHGAGYRAVYDLADLDRSVFIATPGQSGHPLSPHWGDLAQAWADGRHFPIAGSRDALAATGSVLRLEPAGRP